MRGILDVLVIEDNKVVRKTRRWDNVSASQFEEKIAFFVRGKRAKILGKMYIVYTGKTMMMVENTSLK